MGDVESRLSTVERQVTHLECEVDKVKETVQSNKASCEVNYKQADELRSLYLSLTGQIGMLVQRLDLYIERIDKQDTELHKNSNDIREIKYRDQNRIYSIAVKIGDLLLKAFVALILAALGYYLFGQDLGGKL